MEQFSSILSAAVRMLGPPPPPPPLLPDLNDNDDANWTGRQVDGSVGVCAAVEQSLCAATSGRGRVVVM